MAYYLTGRTELCDHVPFTSYAVNKDGNLIEIREQGNRFHEWARFETAAEAAQALGLVKGRENVHLQVTVM